MPHKPINLTHIARLSSSHSTYKSGEDFLESSAKPHIKSQNTAESTPLSITPKAFYKERRQFLKLGAGSLVSLLGVEQLLAQISDKTLSSANQTDIYNAKPITPKAIATSYNNFYEFGFGKSDPAMYSHRLITHPWEISIQGAVEKPFKITLESLLRSMTLVKRIYRFRCVEAWSMVIPWVGFELRELLDFIKPTKEAKFIRFTTLYEPTQMPMQRTKIFPFPYQEALRLDEARHPLTLMAVGMYDEPLLPQNGAPMRLVVPWKYGYKAIKSINKIELLTTQPISTWEAENPKEYGFYGNVDPQVPHPRWSQSSERLIGQSGRVPTLYLNGYEKEVAHLYAGLDRKKLY